MEQYMSE